MKLYAELARLTGAGEPCALCTIVKTSGSTPGKTSMKMLVRRDGSFVGTVGGGCLEAEVLEAALAAMGDERPRLLAFALNERDYPDSGLLCGGRVEILVEPIVQPRLYLFGGGHVASAIARTAVQDANAQVHAEVYKANEDQLDGLKWEWVAALDSRTCPTCAPLDGKRWDKRSDADQWPAHINCRCRVFLSFVDLDTTRVFLITNSYYY